MKINFDTFKYQFTRNQASNEEIHENIIEGINMYGSNFIILMCAIIIASIGLNMNSVAVIIGAMLISPLMGPIIAIGYGQTQGVPHKSKNVEDVSKYEGTIIPSWFISGVDGALLAPTALNKQDFMLIGNGNRVKIECSNGIFTGSNVGLIKYHFELGAGKGNFEWEN